MEVSCRGVGERELIEAEAGDVRFLLCKRQAAESLKKGDGEELDTYIRIKS